MDPITRGYQAQELLSNQVLKESIEGIRNHYITLMENVAIGDVDTQHNLVLSLQVLKEIRRQLERIVRDGQLEESKQKR